MNPDNSSTQRPAQKADWRPMAQYPKTGPIIHARVQMADGTIHEDAHWACGGGEDQPAFEGWFIPDGSKGFFGIDDPIAWMPKDENPAQNSGEKICPRCSRQVEVLHFIQPGALSHVCFDCAQEHRNGKPNVQTPNETAGWRIEGA